MVVMKDRILRRAYLAQGVGATIDGIALSSAVLYFSVHVGVAPGQIGLVLTVATLLALLLVVPIGIVADAIGLKVAAVALSALVVVAFAAYALAQGVWLYAVGACLFMVTQAGLGAVRQAIVADNVDPAARVRGRAVMQTLRNAGLGLGTVAGTLAAVSTTDTPFIVAFVLAAGLALGCTAIFARLPIRPRAEHGARQRPGLIALRDRRYLGICALASMVLLTMPILGVLLPLWITEHLHAASWVAPLTLGLNAVLVIGAQTRWSARILTDAHAAGSLAIGAGALLLGCVLIGTADGKAAVARRHRPDHRGGDHRRRGPVARRVHAHPDHRARPVPGRLRHVRVLRPRARTDGRAPARARPRRHRLARARSPHRHGRRGAEPDRAAQQSRVVACATTRAIVVAVAITSARRNRP